MPVTDDEMSDNSLCRQMGVLEQNNDTRLGVFKAILLKHKYLISNAFYKWRLMSKSRSKGEEVNALANLMHERHRIITKQAFHKWAYNCTPR